MSTNWDLVQAAWLKNPEPIYKPRQECLPSPICEKLFSEYMKKSKCSPAEECQEECEISAKNVPDKIFRRRLNSELLLSRSALIKAEHEQLSTGLKKIRELEEHRQRLIEHAPLRLHADVDITEPDEDYDFLFEEIAKWGPNKENKGAIFALRQEVNKSQVKTAELQLFVDTVSEIIAMQSHLSENAINEINKYVTDSRSEIHQIMVNVLIKAASNILEAEGLTNTELGQFTESGIPMWCYNENVKNIIIESAKSSVLKSEEFNNILDQRRQVQAKATQLFLDICIQILKVDIRLRELFARYRVPMMKITNYDPNLWEKFRDLRAFKNLGSTTSLKNKTIISRSVQSTLLEACNSLASLS